MLAGTYKGDFAFRGEQRGMKKCNFFLQSKYNTRNKKNPGFIFENKTRLIENFNLEIIYSIAWVDKSLLLARTLRVRTLS